MSARQSQTRLRCELLEPREAPSTSPWLNESFDQTQVGAIPTGWNQWSNQAVGAFAVESTRALSGTNGFASNEASSLKARSWYGQVMPAAFRPSASVYLARLQPLQLL